MTLLCVDVRIDAPAKEIIEVAVERLPVQNAAANLIPRERREVAQIEIKGWRQMIGWARNSPSFIKLKSSSLRDQAA